MPAASTRNKTEMPATRLRIVLVTCMLLFIMMEGAKPVMGKKDKQKGSKAMVNALGKKVKGMESLLKCKPCLLIEQLTERLKKIDDEIEKLKHTLITSPPLSMDNPAPRGTKPARSKKDKNKGIKAMANALKKTVKEMENLLKCDPCLSIKQLTERLNKIDVEIEKLKHTLITSPPLSMDNPAPRGTNPSRSKKDKNKGMKAMVNALKKKVEGMENLLKCDPCLSIEQLTERLSKIDDEIEKLKHPPTTSPPPPSTNSSLPPPPSTNSPPPPPHSTNSSLPPLPPTNSSLPPPPPTNSPPPPPPSTNSSLPSPPSTNSSLPSPPSTNSSLPPPPPTNSSLPPPPPTNSSLPSPPPTNSSSPPPPPTNSSSPPPHPTNSSSPPPTNSSSPPPTNSSSPPPPSTNSSSPPPPPPPTNSFSPQPPPTNSSSPLSPQTTSPPPPPRPTTSPPPPHPAIEAFPHPPIEALPLPPIEALPFSPNFPAPPVPLGSNSDNPADSCAEIAASEEGKAVSGTYWLKINGEEAGIASEPLPVYCDMTPNSQAWVLIARFSNTDRKHWMKDLGNWWYSRFKAKGNITDPSDNADMLSPAFWLASGSELKITRSDDTKHTALLQTTDDCLGGQTFRSKITSYGDFNINGTRWARHRCMGNCAVKYSGQYQETEGFQQAMCNGTMQSFNKIGFWCNWGWSNSVMMIGGGGRSCSGAGQGVGVSAAKLRSLVTEHGRLERDFANHQWGPVTQAYALNLWIRG